MNQTENLIISL